MIIILYRSQFTCKYKYIDVLPKIDDGIRKENKKYKYYIVKSPLKHFKNS